MLALAAALSALLTASTSADVFVFLTTADQAHLFESLPSIPLSAASATPSIRVEKQTKYQPIVGFGAAITDAAAWVLSTAKPFDELMELLFADHSKGGVSLGMLRVPMGVSDFSVSYADGNITYADTRDDWSLEHFSTSHDDAYILPVLRRARQLNPDVKIVASPWTAPLWLKTGHQVAPQIGEGSLLDTPQAYETYAEYFVRFVQEYRAKGVVVDYLTLQNEPSHSGCGTMPCMFLPEWQEATLAIKVGEKLKAAGLTETKILAYDHNWGSQAGVKVSGPAYPTAMLKNSSVSPWIGGVAWHCYGGSEAAQTPVHDLDPTKEVHMTECSGGGWSGPWHSNFISNIRRLFVGGVNNWAQSAVLWNMALDEHAGPRCQGGACCTDCRGVVTVPSNATSLDAVTRNVEFYSLAHFSALVPSGSVRIKTQRGPHTSPDSDGISSTTNVTADHGKSCSTYCAAPDACGWTKEYSCPWAAKPGSAGRAGDDGSAGYECCCVDRTAASQHCGGNGTRSDTGSLQFTGFLTPAGETVLQVLNPTDADTLKFSVADEGRGFEFSLPPGLATFRWR
jgi:glucosylceramidase